MIFLYNRNMAFKYLFFGLFGVSIIAFTLKYISVFPYILLFHLFLIWVFSGMFIRAWSLFTKKIIVSQEGINFYKGRKIERILNWDEIENTSNTPVRVIFKVGKEFIYISSELKNYHLFSRLIKQHMDLPKKYRGEGLPSREDLEKIKNMDRLKISRNDDELKASNTKESDMLPAQEDLEFFGAGDTKESSSEFQEEQEEDDERDIFFGARVREENNLPNEEELEFFGSSDDKEEALQSNQYQAIDKSNKSDIMEKLQRQKQKRLERERLFKPRNSQKNQ